MKSNELTPKQILFVNEYAQNSNVAKVCRDLGISTKTAFCWLKQEKVKTEIDKRLALLSNKAMQKLQIATEKAVDTLLSILEDSKTSNFEKIKASETILKSSVKAYEVRAIEKIDRLETFLQEELSND